MSSASPDRVGGRKRGLTYLLFALFAAGALAYLIAVPALGPPGSRPRGSSGRAIFEANCAVCHGFAGSGGVGPRLSAESLVAQFPDLVDQVAFVLSGSRRGERYGASGTGTGGMPGFAGRLTRREVETVVRYERGL